jgi:hypothetical protein
MRGDEGIQSAGHDRYFAIGHDAVPLRERIALKPAFSPVAPKVPNAEAEMLLPREQLETRHGTPDIWVFQRL